MKSMGKCDKYGVLRVSGLGDALLHQTCTKFPRSLLIVVITVAQTHVMLDPWGTRQRTVDFISNKGGREKTWLMGKGRDCIWPVSSCISFKNDSRADVPLFQDIA